MNGLREIKMTKQAKNAAVNKANHTEKKEINELLLSLFGFFI